MTKIVSSEVDLFRFAAPFSRDLPMCARRIAAVIGLPFRFAFARLCCGQGRRSQVQKPSIPRYPARPSRLLSAAPLPQSGNLLTDQRTKLRQVKYALKSLATQGAPRSAPISFLDSRDKTSHRATWGGIATSKPAYLTHSSNGKSRSALRRNWSVSTNASSGRLRAEARC